MKQSKVFHVVILLIVIFFTSACSHLFYYPSQHKYSDPAEEGYSYDEIKFESLDGTELSAWHLKAKGEKKNITVLQFHGNAQNMTSHYAILSWVVDHGYDLFTFDYRGYGESEGRPNPEGVHKDAVSAIRFLLNNYEPLSENKVILFGQSLGGALVFGALPEIKGQDRQKIQSVVVDGAFASYQGIAKRKLASSIIAWPFQWLAYLLLSDRYSGEKKIAEISPIPLLVIHGTKDYIVSLREGEIIYEKAKDPKEIWRIEGAGHLQTLSVNEGEERKRLLEYWAKIKD